MEDNRTIHDLAKEAIQIQDACNLSGLVHSWSRSIKRLRELNPMMGTDELNRHPINQLWADKVYDLTGCTNMTEYGWIYDRVHKLWGGLA